MNGQYNKSNQNFLLKKGVVRQVKEGAKKALIIGSAIALTTVATGFGNGEENKVYAAVNTDQAVHTTISIVDYMSKNQMDPSFENRLLLAEQYGIPHYIGSAAQNIQLLDILKDGSSQKKAEANQLLNINTSIVDYLKSHNIDSTFANRKSIAGQHGITNYIGSAVQNVDLLRILKDINLEGKIALNTDVSVVDYMKARDMDSSFDNRSSLAKQYGIDNYRGTGEQNINLLNILKGDKSANNSVSSQKSNSNQKEIASNAKEASKVNESSHVIDNKETEKGLEETTKSASSASKQNNAVVDEVKEPVLPSKPVDNNKGKNDSNSDKPTKPSEKPSNPSKPKDPVDDSKEKDPVKNDNTDKEDNGSEKPTQPEEKPEKPVEEPEQPSNPVEDEDEVEVPSNPEPTEPSQPEEEPEKPVEEEPEQPEDVVTTETTTETDAVAFEVVEENDPTLEKGQTVVMQEGQNGVRTITYKETYTNGKLTSKEQVSSEITQQPVNKVVKVGIKEAASATQVLDGAGVFAKAGNTYSLNLGQGTDVSVQVNGDKVSSITFNASNYLGWDMPLETSIDLWGEERGKEEYNYAQSQRAKIEKAVRAAADAVYGKGTSQANSLYNQIINSEGYSESF